MNSNWYHSPEMPKLGQNWLCFVLCDFEIWRMTLKNNRAHLLCHTKPCTSFRHHMWIQTRDTVWKQLNWVLTYVTLTFDLWPWPFAWTSLLSIIITPEIFMIIRWEEHSQKGVMDGRTDGRTDRQTETLSYKCHWRFGYALHSLVIQLNENSILLKINL